MPDPDFKDVPVWTLTKDALTIVCVVRAHPRGVEVLVTIADVSLHAQPHTKVEDALAECERMRQRMLATGWA